MASSRRFNARIARFIKEHTVEWAVVQAIAYFAMIPLSIWVFPRTTLLVTIVVLFASLTGALNDLAGTITDAHQDEQIADLTEGDNERDGRGAKSASQPRDDGRDQR